jgi:hypothetical protein
MYNIIYEFTKNIQLFYLITETTRKITFFLTIHSHTAVEMHEFLDNALQHEP